MKYSELIHKHSRCLNLNLNVHNLQQGEEDCVPLLMRVGACADELRIMGGERGSTLDGVVGAGKESASVARKVSSAWAPPAIKRVW